MTKEEAATKLSEFIGITAHDTDYFRGLVNGMILARSMLTDEAPRYFGPPWMENMDTRTGRKISDVRN